MPPSRIHPSSSLPNATGRAWSISSRLPHLPGSPNCIQHRSHCLRRRCQMIKLQAAPDEEPAQNVQEGVDDAENQKAAKGKKSAEAEYLGKLSKEPYAVAILGLVALSKGIEAIEAAAKGIMDARERTGEENAMSGKSLVDREFWKNVGSSVKFSDTKAALQSLNKNINEWSRTLGDASDWLGDELKEDASETASNLKDWVKLQRNEFAKAADSLKLSMKPEEKKAGPSAAVKTKEPVKRKDQGSAFGDVWKALQTLRKAKTKAPSLVVAEKPKSSVKTVKKEEDKKSDSEPKVPVVLAKGTTVAEPSEKPAPVEIPVQAPVQEKDDVVKAAEEAAKKAQEEAKQRAEAAEIEAKAKAEEAEKEAKKNAMAEAQAREDLVKKTAGTPKTVSSAAEVSQPPSVPGEEPSTVQQDKSVAAMVDKIVADTKAPPSTPRPRRNISKPRTPPPPPPPPPQAMSTPSIAKDPPKAPSPPPPTESLLSSSTSSSPKGSEPSKPVLSSSSSEKKGPGTAAFFKTAGKSVSGGVIGGSGGMSIQQQDGSKLSATPLERTTGLGSPRKGNIGEELGKSTVKPTSYVRPNLQVEATGSGGGFSGSGDGTGSGGNGGSGDSQEEESGDPSPKNFPFLWVFLLAVAGAAAYKLYADKKASEENGSSPDGQFQYSSTGK